MNSSFKFGLVVVISAFCLTSLMSCTTQTKSIKVDGTWLSNMHRLSAAHQFLVAWSADGTQFSNPANRELIKINLEDMNSAATDIVADNNAPNADPMFAFTSLELAKEVRKSYAAFTLNDLQMSRFSLARTSNYCISCHTRSDRGVKDYPINWSYEISKLNTIQKIELLLANRHYQSGFNLAKELSANEGLAQSDSRSWILAIEKTLGMIVRVNSSADQAEELVEAVLKNKGAPLYLRRDAFQWKLDIQAWKTEMLGKKKKNNFNAVIQLVQQAQKSGLRSQTAFIKYLRASGILHVLIEDTASKNYGKVLLYSGIVSDALKDLNMGNLDQYYYESCISQEPHSELAERCFARLENSVKIANPFLDIDSENNSEEVSRLAKFRKIAEVKNEISEPKWQNRLLEKDSEKIK